MFVVFLVWSTVQFVNEMYHDDETFDVNDLVWDGDDNGDDVGDSDDHIIGYDDHNYDVAYCCVFWNV